MKLFFNIKHFKFPLKKVSLLLYLSFLHFIPLSCNETLDEEKPVQIPNHHLNLTDFRLYKTGDDWSPALNRAFTKGDTIFIPAGVYHLSETSIPDNKVIYGESSKTILKPLGRKLFIIEGDEDAEIPIAQNIANFSNSIVLSSVDNLSIANDIFIMGQRNSMVREGVDGVHYNTDWVLGRTRNSSCFYGEFDLIKSIIGNNIITENNRLFPSYYADNMSESNLDGLGEYRIRNSTTIKKLSMRKNITLKSFTIEGNSKCYTVIDFLYAKDCKVENVTFHTSSRTFTTGGTESLTLINAKHSLRIIARNCHSKFSASMLEKMDELEKVYANFTTYNLFRMISCWDSGFEDCSANAASHAFSITRSATASLGGGIPSVNCFIRNCVSEGSVWAGVVVQQGCYNTKLTGNIVRNSTQGIFTAGRNTLIENNQLTCNMPYNIFHYYVTRTRGGSIGIGLNEGYACGSIVKNNNIKGYYTGISILDGYEDKNCFEEGDIHIQNNTVENCLLGCAVFKNNFNIGLGRKNLSIYINNNTFYRKGEHIVSVDKNKINTTGILIAPYTVGVEISNNNITNFYHGIHLQDFVDYIKIKSNILNDISKGILLNTINNNPENYKVHVHTENNIYTNVNNQMTGLTQSFVILN